MRKPKTGPIEKSGSLTETVIGLPAGTKSYNTLNSEASSMYNMFKRPLLTFIFVTFAQCGAFQCNSQASSRISSTNLNENDANKRIFRKTQLALFDTRPRGDDYDVGPYPNSNNLNQIPTNSSHDAVDGGSVHSRRNVINGILAAATTATYLPHASFATSGENNEVDATSDTAATEPFKVILTVQTDATKDDTSEIEIEVRPDWAPLASNRFRELVEIGFYNDSRFFRVLPGYVAQFGIAANPKLNKEWMFCEKNCRALPDEPRGGDVHNKRGTLSFASSGKNSRQTQVFINLGNNDGPPNFLDAQSFVPFARVVRGMDDTVKQLNSEYGILESVSGGLAGSVNQGKAAYYGAEYLDAMFPKLSIIRNAKII